MMINLGKLRRKLHKYFNKSELKNLAFDLRLNHENISSNTLDEFVRELIAFCQRHNRIEELIERCEVERPNIDWKSVYSSGTQSSHAPRPKKLSPSQLEGILGIEFSGIDLNKASLPKELKPVPKVNLNKTAPSEQIFPPSKDRLILRYPDYIFLTSAYGKGALSNPQPFIDVTANVMILTNLKYGRLENQQLIIVDANGRPKKTIRVNDKYASISQRTQRMTILPDMLFIVLIRGIDSQNQSRYAILSLLGDRISTLIKVIEDGQLLDTLPIEAEILYQSKDMPTGNELKKLAQDYRFSDSQVQLELGKAKTDASKKSFLSRVFDFWKKL